LKHFSLEQAIYVILGRLSNQASHNLGMEQMQIEERLESFKKQEQEFKDKVDVLQKEVLPQLHPDVSMW
jgi:hypothetical protein